MTTEYTTEEFNTILTLIGEFDNTNKSIKKYTTENNETYKFIIINEDETDEELLETVGYIVSSKYRQRVMDTLDKNKYKTPIQISQETDIIQNHISNVLKELSERDLIKCVTPFNRKGRLYTLTTKGSHIKNEFLS